MLVLSFHRVGPGEQTQARPSDSAASAELYLPSHLASSNSFLFKEEKNPLGIGAQLSFHGLLLFDTLLAAAWLSVHGCGEDSLICHSHVLGMVMRLCGRYGFT